MSDEHWHEKQNPKFEQLAFQNRVMADLLHEMGEYDEALRFQRSSYQYPDSPQNPTESWYWYELLWDHEEYTDPGKMYVRTGQILVHVAKGGRGQSRLLEEMRRTVIFEKQITEARYQGKDRNTLVRAELFLRLAQLTFGPRNTEKAHNGRGTVRAYA